VNLRYKKKTQRVEGVVNKEQTSRNFNSVWLLAFTLQPEDEGSMFLRNVGELLPEYRTSSPRRQCSSSMKYCLYFRNLPWD
jgi:hypothetical protein